MDQALTAKIQRELEQIQAIIEDITGFHSNWNGVLILVEEADFLGKKPFDCRIELDAGLAVLEVRWRTLIHELIHALSAGYNRSDFDLFYGWEEGLVEGLQRLMRPAVLARLGVDVSERVFEAVETKHPYNDYVAAWERIRLAVGAEDAQTFYISMLQTPLRNRHASLLRSGLQIGGDAGKHIISVVSAQRAILESRRS